MKAAPRVASKNDSAPEQPLPGPAKPQTPMPPSPSGNPQAPSLALEPVGAATSSGNEGTSSAGIASTPHLYAGRDAAPAHLLPSRAELPSNVPVQITHAVGSATGPVTEITLAPEELGNLRIEISTEGDRVSLTLQAERPDTLDLLRRHADRLLAEFRAAGFSEMNLGFSNLGTGEGARDHLPPQIREQAESSVGDRDVASGSDLDTRQKALSGSALYLRL